MKIKIEKNLLDQIPTKNRVREAEFFDWFYEYYGFEMEQIVYDYYLFKLEEEENCTGILNIYGPKALQMQYPAFHDTFYFSE